MICPNAHPCSQWNGLAAGLVRPGLRWLACALLLGLVGSLPAKLAAELAPFRLGFSTQMLVDVNESDARASLKIWAQTLGAERGFPVDPALQILNGTEAIKDALLRKKVDGVSMTTPEYWALRRVAPLGPFVSGRVEGEITEEYLLLVHRDNPATRLADLRGQSLIVLAGTRASLAETWVETLFLDKGLGIGGDFWGRITKSTKLSRAVLPVFFRQADACVVNRRGFRTMSELNPQVGQQLKILAQFPAFLPVVFCFCGDMVLLHRDRFLAQIGTISQTPAGSQILSLFHSDALAERPESDLATACALLAPSRASAGRSRQSKARQFRRCNRPLDAKEGASR
jgi:ABC-type phosphate/phosphonate transport system substrate-binding protein